MKQIRHAILFSLLLVLACYYVNASSESKASDSVTLISAAGADFNEYNGHPISALEYSGIVGHSVSHVFKVGQKLPGYLDGYSGTHLIHEFRTPVPVYAFVELFGNTNLSYNYPAHHFW